MRFRRHLKSCTCVIAVTSGLLQEYISHDLGYSFDAIHEPTGASDAYDQFVTSNRQNDIMFYRQDNPVAYIGKAGTLFECCLFTNECRSVDKTLTQIPIRCRHCRRLMKFCPCWVK